MSAMQKRDTMNEKGRNVAFLCYYFGGENVSFFDATL